MRATSLKAFFKIIDSGTLGRRQKEVYNALKENGNMTNAEIANYLHRPINTVTPRCLELRELGLVEEKNRRKCSITKHLAIEWGLI